MITTIKEVIKEVKSVRGGENSAWIFDKEGNIKEDVFCIDILSLLKALDEDNAEENAEDLNVIEDWFYENYDKADNTYNYNCNISNDICYYTKGDYTLVKIHLIGDARANYSDSFVICTYGKDFIEYLMNYYEDYLVEFKPINDEYEATIDALSEGIEIYNSDGEYITTIYDIEKENILTGLGL